MISVPTIISGFPLIELNRIASRIVYFHLQTIFDGLTRPPTAKHDVSPAIHTTLDWLSHPSLKMNVSSRLSDRKLGAFHWPWLINIHPLWDLNVSYVYTKVRLCFESSIELRVPPWVYACFCGRPSHPTYIDRVVFYIVRRIPDNCSEGTEIDCLSNYILN